MTYKRAAQLALECQDASNLSGVLGSFKEVVHEVLWPEARKREEGTRWVNEHPIAYMFLYKLMALNGHEPLSDWEAYNQNEVKVKAIIQAEEMAELAALADACGEIKANAERG